MSVPSFDAFTSQLLRGSAWMVAMRWSLRLVGLVSTAILARLLMPEDFGIVAMAAVVAGLLDTAAYAGVDLALIRADDDSRAYRDSAFTIQLLQSIAIAALLVACAPFAAAYYSEPRVAIVLYCVAARAVIEGLNNIGIVAFRKELDFAKEFRFNLYSKLINLAIVVAAAFWLRNYLALVVGMISGAAIGAVLSYAMHPYRPRLSLAKARALWSFSNWLLVSRVGSFASRKADQFIVGGAVGATALGNYHVATELATMPTTELVMPMRRALFPTLAKLQNDAAGFRTAVLRVFSALALLCFAMGFGLVGVSSEVVRIVLGPKWLDAIPLMQWLALYGAFAALASVLEVPIWVKGKTQFSALQSWIELVALAPLIIVAVRAQGLEGAALARTLVAVGMLPLMLYMTARTCPIGMLALAAAIWRPLLAGAVMLACLLLPLPYPHALALALAAKVALGAAVYAACVLVLWVASGRPDGVEAAIVQRATLLARSALR
jgi:O-antigen/teichoic acid export membrane protein